MKKSKPFRINIFVLMGQCFGATAMLMLGYADKQSVMYYLMMMAILLGLSIFAPGD